VNPFLSLLHSISSGLSDTELSAMKFLCRDRITKRKLEAVQSGRELFTILMEQREIASGSLEFLRKLLQHIHRDDLVAQLVQFEEEEPHAPDDQPDVHEKRLLEAAFRVICANVGREWKKLVRELGMPEVKLDRIEVAHRYDLYEQLIQALREWQRWRGKDAKVADLIKALRGCNLNLVADKVEE
ncbi:FADD protein, partial [Pachycephala philippinensis]|nr:FADD protein [Pachycephala philippinensis]